MVAAMAGFAIEDMLLKAAAVQLPVGQVMGIFGGGGALIYWALARRRGEVIFPRSAFQTTMLVRTMFEILGRLFYTLAIALTPLSSATAILQAAPIVVVAGAAIVFREQVGWRRWSAIAVGLAGVIVILQPGASEFNNLSILAVLGMLGFAGRDLATRAAPKALGTNALGVWGFLAILVAGAVFGFYEGATISTPDGMTLVLMAVAVCVGTIAYSALTRAMRTGDVSAVTPFRYTRLVFGVGLGVVFFGETLDPTTIAGSAVVVVAGLYILVRGRARNA